eukprot:1634503-Rhodomonas_salina.2
MHATDRKTGETLEKEFDGETSVAPTQPAHNKTSEDGGASGVRADPTEQLTEILNQLQKPLSAVGPTDEVLWLRKRVWDLEAETGMDLGTTLADPTDPNTTNSTIGSNRNKYKGWLNGVQVPLNAKLEKLKDEQLGRALAHHNFVFKLPADWFPEAMEIKAARYVRAKRCYGQQSTGGKAYYLDCEVIEPVDHHWPVSYTHLTLPTICSV